MRRRGGVGDGAGSGGSAAGEAKVPVTPVGAMLTGPERFMVMVKT